MSGLLLVYPPHPPEISWLPPLHAGSGALHLAPPCYHYPHMTPLECDPHANTLDGPHMVRVPVADQPQYPCVRDHDGRGAAKPDLRQQQQQQEEEEVREASAAKPDLRQQQQQQQQQQEEVRQASAAKPDLRQQQQQQQQEEVREGEGGRKHPNKTWKQGQKTMLF